MKKVSLILVAITISVLSFTQPRSITTTTYKTVNNKGKTFKDKIILNFDLEKNLFILNSNFEKAGSIDVKKRESAVSKIDSVFYKKTDSSHIYKFILKRGVNEDPHDSLSEIIVKYHDKTKKCVVYYGSAILYGKAHNLHVYEYE